MSDALTTIFNRAAQGEKVSNLEITAVLGGDPQAEVRLAATAALLRRSHLSAVRSRQSGTEWAEALFCLERGYERRLADPLEWDEWEEALYESAQDALIAEHEMSVGL